MLIIEDPPSSGSVVPYKTYICESLVTAASLTAGSGFWGVLARTNWFVPLRTSPAIVNAFTYKTNSFEVSATEKVVISNELI